LSKRKDKLDKDNAVYESNTVIQKDTVEEIFSSKSS